MAARLPKKEGFSMKHTFIRKPLSVLLSILMALSVFGGLTISSSAAEKTIAEGVIYKQGDTIVLPGNGVYYVKGDKYSHAQEIVGNGTVTQFEGDEYSYMLEIEEWGIPAYLDMFDYEEEMNQGLSVLGITFTGSGTQSDPYMPKLAFGEVESTWAGEGEGTEDSPWLIKDLNDLRALSANVASGMTYSGKYLKLAADIDCGSDNWEAIGGKNKFMGTFDGDSHTITYNVAYSGDEDNKGLFYEIGAGGTVKNLNVAGSINCASLYADYLGGIAVYNSGTITNCASSVDITGYGNTIAGIAAYCKDGAKITYCAATGTISWPQTGDFYSIVAGITGGYDSTTISNCASLCDIIAPNADADSYAGRLVASGYGGTYSDNYYLSTAQIEGEVNSDYATAKTADELKEIGQAAYDAGYTVYGLALGAVASNPDQEAADAVIALIDAIGEVVLTDECKQKIDAARNAYDALTDAQKALVSNYETLQFAEGQYAALQLAADMTAFETYKTEKKAAMDALLQEGDSEAVQSIVGLAKTQIEGFTYDESKTLDENKAALDTLVANVPNAVAEQRATDLYAAKIEFDHYKAEQKAAVEAMAQEGDSEAVAQIIADAAAAIDALIYDEFYTLAENKATVDTLANIADRLAAQRAADAAAAQLAADKAAFDAYKFNLVAAVQAMAQDGDSEAAAQIITDAAAAIALLDYDTAKTLDENKAAVDALADIADALAAQRAADAAAAQLAADKAAFDDYKADQKAAVQALAEEGDSAAAAQIVAEAVAAIEALTYDEAKTLDENKAAVDALADIADALASQRAADAAAAALAEAKEAAKAAIRNHKNVADYREAEQAELADIIENACVAIDAATDTAAVSVIRSATIALINEIKTDAQLTAEEKVAADQAAADEVAALIDAIGEVEYNDESKAKIDAARAAYDALTDDQKALVENVEDLTAAEAKYDELKAAAETPDDPEEPVEDGVCPICGKTHNGGIFDKLVGFIHSLIAIFRSMFSFNSSGC